MMCDAMKKIFVCSPFGGKQVNIDRAKEYCKFVLSKDAAPFAPHLLFPQMLDDSKEEDRRKGIACGLEYLSMCDEIWIFIPEGEQLSDGMKMETIAASRANVLIDYMYQDFLEWMRGEKK